MKPYIRSLLVEGQLRIYVSENKLEDYLGANEYYKEIVAMSTDQGLWFCCYDYHDEMVKRINARYVVDIEY